MLNLKLMFDLASFLFIIFCSYQQLKYQIDPEYLFSPINGEGKAERAVVEQYFKVNYTHRFNVGRITRPGKSTTTTTNVCWPLWQTLGK